MAATSLFCRNCKTWFPKSEGCETCGYEGQGFNKSLMTAKLNGHLYATSERVTKEKTDQAHFLKQAKREEKRFAGS